MLRNETAPYMSSNETEPPASVPARGVRRYRVTYCEYVTTTYEIAAIDEGDALERLFDSGKVIDIYHGDGHIDVEEM